MATEKISAARWKASSTCSSRGASECACSVQCAPQECCAASSCNGLARPAIHLLQLLVIDSVAPTWWMRNHEKTHRARRRITDLMSNSRRDAHAAPGRYECIRTIDLHKNFARQNVEELLRALMMVSNFCRARRHELLNHAQLRIFHQIP